MQEVSTLGWMGFVLTGIVSGVASSLFGIGAGIVMVPILTLAFGFDQKVAQGTSLAVMVPLALTGALRYAASPKIQIPWAAVAVVAATGIAGAWVGSALALRLSGIMLRRCFAVFMIVVAIRMLITSSAKTPS